MHNNYPDDKTIFQQAINYMIVQKKNILILIINMHVKQMLLGYRKFSGFLGYYNPFTGEAQVNTKVPQFVIPFTICHEMAINLVLQAKVKQALLDISLQKITIRLCLIILHILNYSVLQTANYLVAILLLQNEI